MATGDGLGAPDVSEADLFTGPSGPDIGKVKGRDDFALGNLIHPSAGYEGGKQGTAQTEEQAYAQQAAAADARQAPQWDTQQADSDLAMGMGARGASTDALGLMRNAAYGNAPSAAYYGQQQAMGNAIAQQYAAANMGRPGSAAAQYGALQPGAAQMGGVVNAGANQRAAETNAALGMYAQQGFGQRGQDLTQRGQSQQQAYQQAQQQLDQTALNDARALAYENMRQKTFEEENRNRQWAEEQNENDFLRQNQIDNTNRQMDINQRNAIYGGIASLGSSLTSTAAQNSAGGNNNSNNGNNG